MGVDKIKVSVRDDQLHRTAVKNETNCVMRWKNKYSWMPEEYEKLQKEVGEISKMMDKHLSRPEDKRSAKPFPATGNGFYGWLAKKSEFRLEKFGPDILTTPALPVEDWSDL